MSILRRSAVVPVAIFAWLCVGSVAWPQSFESLFQRGVALQKAGQPREAAAAYEAALRAGGPSDGNYVWAQSNLAQTYTLLEKYDQAELLLKQALAHFQAQSGPESEDVGTVLGNLGNVYNSQGKFDLAEQCLGRSFVIQLKYHPLESTRVLNTGKFWISTVAMGGDVKKAIQMSEELIKGIEARVGPNDSRLRQPLFSLAGKLRQRGDYRQAEQLIQRAQHLPAPDDQLDADPAAEAITCGTLLSEMGRYPEALAQMVRAEKIYIERSKRLPSFQGMISVTRAGQAEVLLELGQVEKSVQLFEEILPATEARGGAGLPPVLYSLAVGYQRLGQLEKAEALLRRVDATPSFPMWNRLTAGAQLASLLADRGDTVEAEKLLLAGMHPKLEAEASLRAKQHRILGEVYLKTGRPREAEENFRKAIDAHGSLEERQLNEQAACWLGVARALEAQKMYTDALGAADKSRRILHELTVTVLPGLTEPQQLAFLTREDEPDFQSSLAIVQKHSDSAAVERAATWLLNRKGLAQQAVAQRILLAHEANDPALASLVDDWMAVVHQLAKLSVSGGAKSSDAQIAELARREQELATRLGNTRLEGSVEQPWYEIAQLRKALPASTVYIELARCAPPDKPEQAVYLAWIVPPEGKGDVRLFDLGSAEQVDHSVAAVRRELSLASQTLRGLEAEEPATTTAPPESKFEQSLNQLSQQLVTPLLPALTGFEHWVVCPDGAPWLVPWSSLLLPGEKGAAGPYVVEKHRISFVVSGRDLIGKQQPVSGNQPLIMAAADFDHTPQDSSAGRPTVEVAQASSGGSLRGTSGVSTKWTSLSGTAAEARFVAPALTAYAKHEPQILLGLQASETMLKDTWRPRIALLSTHGFFLEPESKTDLAIGLNPLLRCGLVLSGANQSALRQQETADDGIVTGLDVLSTDLRGTELVVLSACETGLGQLNSGEGVAGLRQAFQLAGARAVVATLWRIPDDETSELMSMFFQQLAAGSDKATALALAQRQLMAARRESKKSTHPFFWAAFTLTGDWRIPEVAAAVARPPRRAAVELIEVTAESTRVMDASTIVAQVLQGERFVRGQTNGTWIQIFYQPGSQRSGWIQSGDLRPIK